MWIRVRRNSGAGNTASSAGKGANERGDNTIATATMYMHTSSLQDWDSLPTYLPTQTFWFICPSPKAVPACLQTAQQQSQHKRYVYGGLRRFQFQVQARA